MRACDKLRNNVLHNQHEPDETISVRKGVPLEIPWKRSPPQFGQHQIYGYCKIIISSRRVFASLPLMMSWCGPGDSVNTLRTNWFWSDVPFPRQPTGRGSKPKVSGISQIIAGSCGSASMFTKNEFAPSLGALTLA